jgi:hypothetical protein
MDYGYALRIHSNSVLDIGVVTVELASAGMTE